jgi:biotin synthase
VGQKVYYRGIIEFSNSCEKNCNYCGIRLDNDNVDRYFMTKEEILDSAQFIYDNDYASLVLQSGERTDQEYIDFVDEIIKEIKEVTREP